MFVKKDTLEANEPDIQIRNTMRGNAPYLDAVLEGVKMKYRTKERHVRQRTETDRVIGHHKYILSRVLGHAEIYYANRWFESQQCWVCE